MEIETQTFFVVRRKKDGWYFSDNGLVHDPMHADRYDDFNKAFADHIYDLDEVVEVTLHLSLQVKNFK
ncbi:hypothetical protein PHIM7_67 [Sinorhizobium phage phiM7]|uniref:Uncharacterized protein n=3 Tax=Emdodecavirus TaxID=1980937 RepID=S5MPG8_9CAUD|nr:hypothetical protein AB690_gp073 [Sinorhizobium phage phiM12]YP_009212323.1 hypothetical protein AVT40_gp083 [Sinorhizobium phage phiN3]YP_009601192.1 hypothetical protein FDH46_gp067 [Sinorhizobium phage phiM7]AKF12975.1 hypothetical protein PHIM19_68 [Sinorhizobium phage phiM19]AGR47720.1 hypothetical protein SmphiM12_088 [Sinorhizobium phage phiM12]AKF12615.1 hypothetical protein PHIM7_67 [Sinorhizobium phage phiM7]AKF13347.1 hypothetical protein PHIN3_83 [Sinorhizobium phage phiN3]